MCEDPLLPRTGVRLRGGIGRGGGASVVIGFLYDYGLMRTCMVNWYGFEEEGFKMGKGTAHVTGVVDIFPKGCFNALVRGLKRWMILN